jgi:hypothetical protein
MGTTPGNDWANFPQTILCFSRVRSRPILAGRLRQLLVPGNFNQIRRMSAATVMFF